MIYHGHWGQQICFPVRGPVSVTFGGGSLGFASRLAHVIEVTRLRLVARWWHTDILCAPVFRCHHILASLQVHCLAVEEGRAADLTDCRLPAARLLSFVIRTHILVPIVVCCEVAS